MKVIIGIFLFVILIAVLKYLAYKRKLRAEDLKKIDKLCDTINYMVCRCCDIDWYSNSAVFQTKFERGRSWRHPITTKYKNLEEFQIDYLDTIAGNNAQIREFLEELHDKIRNERL